MNEAIQKLKDIGIETLHEKTHVSIQSLDHIINKRFDAIHHIQFNGFLNIIENELHIDMTSLRNALKEHRQNTSQTKDGRQLFIKTPNEETSNKSLYFIIAAVLAVALFIFIFSKDETRETSYEDSIQSSAVEDAKQHLEAKDRTSVASFTQETEFNETLRVDPVQKEVVKTKVASDNHPFVLYPKESLWIGVINMDTGEQKDTITSEPYPLDETANLLITLGHGYLKVDLNGKTENLSERVRVRYLYKNGTLKRISAEEFKELNKGNSW